MVQKEAIERWRKSGFCPLCQATVWPDEDGGTKGIQAHLEREYQEMVTVLDDRIYS